MKVGYSTEDLQSVPEGSNLGLGCGNPVAIAALKAGEIVLDLGSGAGFDCFLAAGKVGNTGRVIGVDMAPDGTQKGRIERSSLFLCGLPVSLKLTFNPARRKQRTRLRH